MLHDPARHEPLRAIPWDEHQVRVAIAQIVADTESRFHADTYWPMHPLDRDGRPATRQFETPMYDGAAGVFWALHYLEAIGAVTLSRSYAAELDRLLPINRAFLGETAEQDRASFLLGDTPIRMMSFGEAPTEESRSAISTP